LKFYSAQLQEIIDKADKLRTGIKICVKLLLIERQEGQPSEDTCELILKAWEEVKEDLEKVFKFESHLPSDFEGLGATISMRAVAGLQSILTHSFLIETLAQVLKSMIPQKKKKKSP